MTRDRDFTPALGHHAFTGAYDRILALMTRERRWRAELLAAVAPAAGEMILDVGCGTGTFAILMKQAAPGSTVIGVDPDENVLSIARVKAARLAAAVDWRSGYGDALPSIVREASLDKVVSSLVLHQCPMEVKSAILAACWRVLRPGGRLVIADYGQQRTRLMRLLFRQVQLLDGVEHTEPNARGVLPKLIAGAGFARVVEARTIQTPTGSISIYSGERPA